MIVVSNRIYVKPEYAERLEESFGSNASGIKGMKGFVSFYFMRPTNPNAPYAAMTFWETRDDYNAWLGSDHFKQSHANHAAFKDAFSKPPEMEIHEVATEVAAS